MAKRMTDTNKWDDPFYSDMPDNFKLVYNYICDKCDNVGVWKVNKRLVEFHINADINWDIFISYMGERLLIISEEKWWLTKFCDFQYGYLDENSKSKPIISHINLLKNHRLWIGYTKGMHTLKDKDKEKDSFKSLKDCKDNIIISYRKFKHLEISEQQVHKLEEHWSREQIDEILDRIENFAKNKKYSDLYLTAKNWLKKEYPIIKPVEEKIIYEKEFTL